jgi:hypothetical protein
MRETKFPHAVWAAGRGLIALLLPNFDAVDNLWLEPLSWQVRLIHSRSALYNLPMLCLIAENYVL